jgi:AcrR family transcriptional regulator
MKKASDEKELNTEQQILLVAEREFLEKGYDGARTTSIAKSAGVTHAMLHYYFRTKELLFERFIDKKMSEIIPLITYLVGKDELPLRERILEAVSVHFDFIINNPDLPRFLINEVLPYSDRCEMFLSKVKGVLVLFKNMQDEVNEASARGEIEHFNVLMLFQDILAINILPSLMTKSLENLLTDDSLTVEQYLMLRKSENIEIIKRRIEKK